jgi:hypothetical protein
VRANLPFLSLRYVRSLEFRSFDSGQDKAGRSRNSRCDELIAPSVAGVWIRPDEQWDLPEATAIEKERVNLS